MIYVTCYVNVKAVSFFETCLFHRIGETGKRGVTCMTRN